MGQIGGVLGVVLGTLLGNINLQMPIILGGSLCLLLGLVLVRPRSGGGESGAVPVLREQVSCNNEGWKQPLECVMHGLPI